MKTIFCARAHLALGVAAFLAVSGCSLLNPLRHEKAAAKSAVLPPAPVFPTPAATHQFQLGDRDEVVGYVQKVIVGKEDTLPDIARRFDVGYEEMVLANPGVDPWLPGAGREIVVPTQFVLPTAVHEGVVVNVAQMRIYYYPPAKKGEKPTVITHPIGIGKIGWKTPEGTTKIVARQKDPVWVVPKSVRDEHKEDGDILPAKVPAGPDNPLGAYEFRLGWPSYLIHGTNKPYGVGMRSSHGCMRLYPEDIAVLFDLVPLGTKVTVVNQPYLFGWHGGQLYLQAFAVMEDDKRGWDKLAWNKNHARLLDRLLAPKLRQRIATHDGEIDWDKVGELAHQPRGVPVPITGGGGSVDSVLAMAQKVENTLPTGSNWDGKGGLLVDEKTFNEMLGTRTKPEPPANSTEDSQSSRTKVESPASDGGATVSPGDGAGGAPASAATHPAASAQ